MLPLTNLSFKFCNQLDLVPQIDSWDPLIQFGSRPLGSCLVRGANGTNERRCGKHHVTFTMLFPLCEPIGRLHFPASLAVKLEPCDWVWPIKCGQEWCMLFAWLGVYVLMCDPPAVSFLAMRTMCSRMCSNKVEKGYLLYVGLVDCDENEK